MAELEIDDIHSERLRKILGIEEEAWISQQDLEAAIDELYGRMFPDLINQQHEQEYDR
jgi:hypothetical protein